MPDREFLEGVEWCTWGAFQLEFCTHPWVVSRLQAWRDLQVPPKHPAGFPPPRPASPPPPPTPPPRPSLLRATWPRSSLASGPAGARGPLSLLRACAQPSRGPERPSCPAPARCPKPPGATSAVNQELVRPAPPLRPPEAPLAPTPPSKHRTFRREQTSDVQAHGQTHRHSQAPTPRETAGRRQRGSQGHSHSTRALPLAHLLPSPLLPPNTPPWSDVQQGSGHSSEALPVQLPFKLCDKGRSVSVPQEQG